MNLDKTKILIKNKEHCKAVIERLNYYGADIDGTNIDNRKGSICIHKGGRAVWGEIPLTTTDFKTITLDDLYEIEKPREKIKLTEHIDNAGIMVWLTDDCEYVSFHTLKNILIKRIWWNKIVRAPNARTIYVWTDTLEYVKEGEK